ncbi:MAG: hypothetical protein M0R38_01675 [Bacteroidia bacterium]|nr:hypothetical protein [Bacteroidia bacterium]
MTKSLKTDAGVLAFAIVLYVSMSAFNMSSLLYIGYVVLAGLYFFPGKLFLTKESMRIDTTLSFLVLCNTLILSYLFFLVGGKGNEAMKIVAIIYGLLNIFFLVYFRVRRDDSRFVLHLIAKILVAFGYPFG